MGVGLSPGCGCCGVCEIFGGNLSWLDEHATSAVCFYSYEISNSTTYLSGVSYAVDDVIDHTVEGVKKFYSITTAIASGDNTDFEAIESSIEYRIDETGTHDKFGAGYFELPSDFYPLTGTVFFRTAVQFPTDYIDMTFAGTKRASGAEPELLPDVRINFTIEPQLPFTGFARFRLRSAIVGGTMPTTMAGLISSAGDAHGTGELAETSQGSIGSRLAIRYQEDQWHVNISADGDTMIFFLDYPSGLEAPQTYGGAFLKDFRLAANQYEDTDGNPGASEHRGIDSFTYVPATGSATRMTQPGVLLPGDKLRLNKTLRFKTPYAIDFKLLAKDYSSSSLSHRLRLSFLSAGMEGSYVQHNWRGSTQKPLSDFTEATRLRVLSIPHPDPIEYDTGIFADLSAKVTSLHIEVGGFDVLAPSSYGGGGYGYGAEDPRNFYHAFKTIGSVGTDIELMSFTGRSNFHRNVFDMSPYGDKATVQNTGIFMFNQAMHHTRSIISLPLEGFDIEKEDFELVNNGTESLLIASLTIRMLGSESSCPPFELCSIYEETNTKPIFKASITFADGAASFDFPLLAGDFIVAAGADLPCRMSGGQSRSWVAVDEVEPDPTYPKQELRKVEYHNTAEGPAQPYHIPFGSDDVIAGTGGPIINMTLGEELIQCGAFIAIGAPILYLGDWVYLLDLTIFAEDATRSLSKDLQFRVPLPDPRLRPGQIAPVVLTRADAISESDGYFTAWTFDDAEAEAITMSARLFPLTLTISETQ